MYSQITGKNSSRRKSKKRNSKVSNRSTKGKKNSYKRSSGRKKISSNNKKRSGSGKQLGGSNKSNSKILIGGADPEATPNATPEETIKDTPKMTPEQILGLAKGDAEKYQAQRMIANKNELEKMGDLQELYYQPGPVVKENELKKTLETTENDGSFIRSVKYATIPTRDHSFDHFMIEATLTHEPIFDNTKFSGLNYTYPNNIFSEYLSANSSEAYSQFSKDLNSNDKLIESTTWGLKPNEIKSIKSYASTWIDFLSIFNEDAGISETVNINAVIFDDGELEPIDGIQTKLEELTVPNFINVLRIEKTVGHFDKLLSDKSKKTLKAYTDDPTDENKKACATLFETFNPKVENGETEFVKVFLRATKMRMAAEEVGAPGPKPALPPGLQTDAALGAAAAALNQFPTDSETGIQKLKDIGLMFLYFGNLFKKRYRDKIVKHQETLEKELDCIKSGTDTGNHRYKKIGKYLKTRQPDFLGLTEFAGPPDVLKKWTRLLSENTDLKNYKIVGGGKSTVDKVSNALIYNSTNFQVTELPSDQPEPLRRALGKKKKTIKPIEPLLICEVEDIKGYVEGAVEEANATNNKFYVIVSHQDGKNPTVDNIPMYNAFNEHLKYPWVLITDANAYLNSDELYGQCGKYIVFPDKSEERPTQCTIRGPVQAQINKCGHFMANCIDYILFGPGNKEQKWDKPDITDTFVWRFMGNYDNLKYSEEGNNILLGGKNSADWLLCINADKNEKEINIEFQKLLEEISRRYNLPSIENLTPYLPKFKKIIKMLELLKENEIYNKCLENKLELNGEGEEPKDTGGARDRSGEKKVIDEIERIIGEIKKYDKLKYQLYKNIGPTLKSWFKNYMSTLNGEP